MFHPFPIPFGQQQAAQMRAATVGRKTSHNCSNVSTGRGIVSVPDPSSAAIDDVWRAGGCDLFEPLMRTD